MLYANAAHWVRATGSMGVMAYFCPVIVPAHTDIIDWFKNLQGHICQALEAADGTGRFGTDEWQRAEGGGGTSRVLTEGAVIEKGAVLYSCVHGPVSAAMRKGLQLDGEHFLATGVSLIQHPRNPWVPIVHMNVRYFELDGGRTCWFGGGIDLTPHYVIDEQATWFHQQLAETLGPFGEELYPKYKTWADDYFYVKHRQETRGVGGIFFDRLMPDAERDKAQIWQMVQAVASAFAPTYTELIRQNKDKTFGKRELAWQALRRGRYAEFNLAIDAGTKFGLETGGRIESILASLPPSAQWQYMAEIEAGGQEAHTQSRLVKGLDWLHMGNSKIE